MIPLFRLLNRLFARCKTDTSGSTATVMALSALALIGAVGAGVDFSNAISVRGRLQDAVDSAVLVGLAEAQGARTTTADQALRNNLKGIEGTVTTTYSETSDSLTGTASVKQPTYLLGLAGYDTLTLRATATAKGTLSTSSPCFLVLDPTGSQALLVNSGAKITAPKCQMDVKSTGSPAGMFNSGSNLDLKKLCVQGSNVTQNSTTVANLALKCATAADPLAGKLPVPSSATCTVSNGNYNDAVVNLSPGVYCGWFNFNNSSAKVTFAPGTYVIKNGGWNVNGGTWTGTGVTFYFADTSKIQFNSGISASLTAPTSGTYKSLLFYEASGLSKSDFIFNDSIANYLKGTIYLPSRNVTFNAKSGTQSDALYLIVNRLILNQTTWTVTPDSDNAYMSGSGGLSKIHLTK